VVRDLDADLIVLPEAYRSLEGVGVLDVLADEGWTVRTTHFSTLAEKVWGPGEVRPSGTWELGFVTRLPARDWRELPMGRVFRDHAEVRNAIACVVTVGDVDIDVVGLHTSSKLWYAGPVTHLRNLAPQLPDASRPAIVAGDFNFWGPAVARILPGWDRAVLGRTYPAHRPHSQIDHILVNEHVRVLSGAVLAACGSDHRPVRARLAVS
jgi:endonuclease/exonuclease/phosphatase (EEP) superfamily protein YafD